MLDQSVDIAESGIVRALGDLRPLGGRQLAFEAVKETVEHHSLSAVEGHVFHGFPESGLPDHGRKSVLRCCNSSSQAIEKPPQPICDIQIAFLRAFQYVVVFGSFLSDLIGQAVEALGRLLLAGKHHLGEGRAAAGASK